MRLSGLTEPTRASVFDDMEQPVSSSITLLVVFLDYFRLFLIEGIYHRWPDLLLKIFG